MSDQQALTAKHLQALRKMVEEWVDEGFTTPPYTDAQYDIFEWLGIRSEQYDIERPWPSSADA